MKNSNRTALRRRFKQKRSQAKKVISEAYKIDNFTILVVYAVWLLLVILVSIYGFMNCDPWHTYHGADSWGNLCSSVTQSLNPVENVSGSGIIIYEKNLVWAINFYSNIRECMPDKTKIQTEELVKICVKSCPNPQLNASKQKTCLEILDENRYNNEKFQYAIEACEVRQTEVEQCAEKLLSNNNNMDSVHHYETVFGKCVSSAYLSDGISLFPDYLTYWHYLGQDAFSFGLRVIEIVFLITALCFLLYVIILKRPEDACIYCIVLSLMFGSLSVFYLAFRLGTTLHSWRKQSNPEEDTVYFFYPNKVWSNSLGLAFSVFSLAYTINRFQLNRSYMSRARGFTIRTSKSFQRLPKLMTQPVWTLFSVAIILTYFAVTAFFINNCEVLVPSEDYSSIKYSHKLSYAISTIITVLIFFIAIWTIMIIKTAQKAVVAGAVKKWYFCDTKNRLLHPITEAVLAVFSNLGNIIACSFNGKVQHYFVIFLANKTVRKTFAMEPNKDDLEKARFISYFSPTAPISLGAFNEIKPTNICGDSFFDQFVFDNLKLQCLSGSGAGDNKMPLNKMIQKVHLSIKQCYFAYSLSISSLSIALSYVSKDDFKEPIYNPTLFLIGIWLISVFICDIWMSVLNSAIDTLALCLYEDIEKNNGKKKPYYSSRGLIYRVTGAKVLLIETKSGLKYKKKIANLSNQIEQQLRLSEARLRVLQRLKSSKRKGSSKKRKRNIVDKVRAFNLVRHQGRKANYLRFELEKCLKAKPTVAKLVSEEEYYSNMKASRRNLTDAEALDKEEITDETNEEADSSFNKNLKNALEKSGSSKFAEIFSTSNLQDDKDDPSDVPQDTASIKSNDRV